MNAGLIHIPLHFILQEGTAEETFSAEEYHLLNHNMAEQSTTEASCRDHAMITWCFNCVSRSDDARMMYMCDIIKPAKLRCVGKFIDCFKGLV